MYKEALVKFASLEKVLSPEDLEIVAAETLSNIYNAAIMANKEAALYQELMEKDAAEYYDILFNTYSAAEASEAMTKLASVIDAESMEFLSELYLEKAAWVEKIPQVGAKVVSYFKGAHGAIAKPALPSITGSVSSKGISAESKLLGGELPAGPRQSMSIKSGTPAPVPEAKLTSAQTTGDTLAPKTTYTPAPSAKDRIRSLKSFSPKAIPVTTGVVATVAAGSVGYSAGKTQNKYPMYPQLA